MPETKKPGTFVWVEIGTTNAAGAKDFYAKVFGWGTQDVPAGDFGTYTLLQRSGKDVGGLYELPQEMLDRGVPPHWLSYIGVNDVDESTEKARSLGAQIMQEPMDVMDVGRMSVITDPTGATFALWQPKKHEGAEVQTGPGTTCWFELVTKDTTAAQKFYTSLFGWTPDTQEMGPITYTIFKRGETQVGGLMAPTPEMGAVPPHWMPYVAVDGCDATVNEAESAGAEIVAPPHDIPNVGRSSTIVDPYGAAFSVIQLIPQTA
jgi:predicted enzyme related to lactoylglutathione lyase